MNNRGLWLGLSFMVACGQELELPVQPGGAGSGGRAGPSSGVTGEAGAGDSADPVQRLPVADTPLFEAGGGAGGEAGVADGAGKAHGSAGTLTAGGKPSGGAGRTGNHAGETGSLAGEAGARSSGSVEPPQLLFTEYVEGTGSSKALELYAVTASSLEGCQLETYFNGKLEPARLALHGDVAAGDTYVLCSSALGSAQPALCDRTTNLTFNGDDALALRCGGVLLDVIGQIGVDPGAAWGDGATADHTLRRHCEVSRGSSSGSEPFDPAQQWSSFGPDLYEDLGQRACMQEIPVAGGDKTLTPG